MSTDSIRKKIIRCKRCGKRCRNMGGWNADIIAGYSAGFICPDCQTVEENLEAAVNEAIENYNGWQPLPFTAENVHSIAAQYVRLFKTPAVIRAKADELLAVRPDLAKGPVALMRAAADDLEAGWNPDE